MWSRIVDFVKLEPHIQDHLQNTVQHHLLVIVILAFSSSTTLSNKILPVSKQIMFDKVVTPWIFVNQTLSQYKQMIPLKKVFSYLTIYCKIHATNMQSLYRGTQSFRHFTGSQKHLTIQQMARIYCETNVARHDNTCVFMTDTE